MRILAVSDIEAKYYYDFYTPGKLDEFDLVLACGDLHREYMEFLVTMSASYISLWPKKALTASRYFTILNIGLGFLYCTSSIIDNAC